MKRVSIIVPVYNEERQLKAVVEYLYASACPLPRDFIFVDDSSTDSSYEILQNLRTVFGFTLIRQESNKGKGAAVIRGIQEASGDIIVIQDADFEYDPADIPALLQPLIDNKADVVLGSRFKKNASQVHRTYHYFVNRFLTMLSNLMSGIYLTDMETCYKVFKSDLLKSMRLESKRFGIEVELTAYIAKTSARIHEIPINYYPRTTLQGKKINWKDGVAAIFHIIKFNAKKTSACFDRLPDRYDSTRSKFELFQDFQESRKL